MHHISSNTETVIVIMLQPRSLTQTGIEGAPDLRHPSHYLKSLTCQWAAPKVFILPFELFSSWSLKQSPPRKRGLPPSPVPHPAFSPLFPGAHPTSLPHLVDHHASLEDGHEVRWLLAHRDPDLDRFIVVLLVQDDGLIGRGCDFILTGLAALGMCRVGGVR